MPAEEGDGTGGGDAKGDAVSAGKVAAARDRTPPSVATPVMSAHLLPVLLAFLGATTPSMGYDAYNACAKPGRASRLLADPPCDFRQQAWCTVPGSAYPWQAVRRFVRENQGLMRRMYGDERAAELMRAQLESNEVEPPPNPAPHAWRERALQRYSARRPQEPPPPPPPTTSSTEASSPSTFSTSTVPTATTQPPTTEPPPPPSVTEMESLRAAERLADGEGNFTTTPVPSTLDDSTWLTEGTETEPDEATTMAESQLFQAAEEDDADTDQDEEEDEEEEEETPEPEKTPAPQVKLKGVNACPVKEEVVAPFWANNTRGEILALLNVYPFEQYVHWEKCTFEHKQMFCREGCRCEQQYRLHRLLAYDPSNECRGIFSDWFKFPSCCVCRCYDLPVAFHVASRSPRAPAWFRGKLRMRNDDHQ